MGNNADPDKARQIGESFNKPHGQPEKPILERLGDYFSDPKPSASPAMKRKIEALDKEKKVEDSN